MFFALWVDEKILGGRGQLKKKALLTNAKSKDLQKILLKLCEDKKMFLSCNSSCKIGLLCFIYFVQLLPKEIEHL